MVEVYLWSGFPGHISLKVDGGSPGGVMYLSRFPATQLAKIGGSGVNQTYAQDVADYGAPSIVRLTRLNETAVKRAVAQAQKAMIYSAFVVNCATHVKFCLDSGGSAVLGAVTHGGLIGSALTDTPQGVYAYAQGLRTLYG